MTNPTTPTAAQALALAAELREHTDASRNEPQGDWQITITPDLADTIATTLDALAAENAKLREAASRLRNLMPYNETEWSELRDAQDALDGILNSQEPAS